MADLYLSIDDQVSIGVDRHEALVADEDWFYDLYRNTVYRADKKVARAWAKQQIAERERVLAVGRSRAD